jgi:hypothetical protein
MENGNVGTAYHRSILGANPLKFIDSTPKSRVF